MTWDEEARAQLGRKILKRREKKAFIEFKDEVLKIGKNFSRDHFKRGIVLRKKLAMSPIRSRKVTRIPSQTTYKITPYTRQWRIVPSEKRARVEGNNAQAYSIVKRASMIAKYVVRSYNQRNISYIFSALFSPIPLTRVSSFLVLFAMLAIDP